MKKTFDFLAENFGITENPNTKELEMCLTPEKIRLIGTFAEMIKYPEKIKNNLSEEKFEKFQQKINQINLHEYEKFISAVSNGLIKMADEICDIRKTDEFTVAEVYLAESCLIIGVEYDFLNWSDIGLNSQEGFESIVVWIKEHIEKLSTSENQEARTSKKQAKAMEETFDGGLYSKEAVENTFDEETSENPFDESNKGQGNCIYFITIPR
ncbi:MAG: hypothetical protein PHR00_00050 [Patescibacteria group bacterium]|nr:hypothetical protein [Patescibacteria group bacterium]